MVEPDAVEFDALDLLAEASGFLTSSFDLSATLPKVADLCIRKLADYCAISAHNLDGAVLLVEAGQRSTRAASTRNLETLPDVLREHGFERVIAAPLQGRDRHLGMFILACADGTAVSETTNKLANILAIMLSNALEQSTLFDRTHRVADRLQRALLPDSFPAVDGAVFHAAYKPASTESEVGGDWYDAFALPDGRIAISMGDVAGHGLEAATVMGEIRHALRSRGIGETSPAAVLQHINGVINLRGNIGMVTAVFAYFTPATRELIYASAGHPVPLLTIADGFSGFLPGGGIPLGADAEIGASDWTLTLPPRSCVIFYTDGMTEYSRDVIAGEQRLLEAGVRSFADDGDNPALALQERVFDRTNNRDDAATLALSCFDGVPSADMRFSAIPVAAPIVRAHVHRLCDRYGLCDEERFALITAVGEAVANAVEHAYRGEPPGYLHVRTAASQTSITVEVEDHGRWRPFERREERGRGIVLMHELMDRVRITSTQKSTLITLVMARRAG